MSACADISRPVRTARQEHAKPALRIVRFKPSVEPANNLRAFMFANGITEAALARESGIDPAQLNHLRNGRRKATRTDTAWCIVDALERLTGKPVAFEAIWPRPEVRA